MSDGLPLIIAGPIGLALSGAIGALWADRKAVGVEARADCAKQIARLEERISKLEADSEHWRDRWEKEVERNIELRNMPAEEEPTRPPPPDWKEDTEVRRQRELIERRALDEQLRRYAESTPPRQRVRPRQK